MQMMNRAIEDAADFTEFKRKLEQRLPKYAHEVDASAQHQKPPKRPDENRQQYRARLRAMEAAK